MANHKIRRIDFHPDEYIAGVGGKLKADEQGVLWLINALIYSEGGPILENPIHIARMTCIRPTQAKKIIQRLVDLGKLERNDGMLSNKRAVKELERTRDRIQTACENGAKGGRPRRKSEHNQSGDEPGGSDDAALTINKQYTTNNKQRATNRRTTPSLAVLRHVLEANGLDTARGGQKITGNGFLAVHRELENEDSSEDSFVERPKQKSVLPDVSVPMPRGARPIRGLD